LCPDNSIKVAPSMLASDFSHFGEQIAEADNGGADYIHLDIMDGHFVPNLTFGPPVVKSIRRWTSLPLDVHMMVMNPGQYVNEMASAGADIITVHVEACHDIFRVVEHIKEVGLKAGVAVSPTTPLSAVTDILPNLDMILVMTVNPGFGGQKFIHEMVPKISRLRTELDQRGILADLEVDGGISSQTAKIVVEAGANVLVAGSAIFNTERSVSDAITSIRESVSSN